MTDHPRDATALPHEAADDPAAESLQDVAYVWLRDGILSGRLRAGAPLDVHALAAELGMSRTPVRDALRTLQFEGLVEVYPSRGSFVSRLTLADIRDLFEVREALDGLAARLAASRRTQADLASLEQLLHEAEQSLAHESLGGVQAAGAAFHDALLAVAGNERLQTMRSSIALHLERARLASYGTPTRAHEAVAEHWRILAAITAGDGAAAEDAMREHLRISAANALRIV